MASKGRSRRCFPTPSTRRGHDARRPRPVAHCGVLHRGRSLPERQKNPRRSVTDAEVEPPDRCPSRHDPPGARLARAPSYRPRPWRVSKYDPYLAEIERLVEDESTLSGVRIREGIQELGSAAAGGSSAMSCAGSTQSRACSACSMALRKAVRDVLGVLTPVQRCVRHYADVRVMPTRDRRAAPWVGIVAVGSA